MNNVGSPDDNRITLLPRFEHKEREDEDVGLPHHPIYSNYTKYLWTSHTRSGGIQAPNASVENTDDVRGGKARPGRRRVG